MSSFDEQPAGDSQNPSSLPASSVALPIVGIPNETSRHLLSIGNCEPVSVQGAETGAMVANVQTKKKRSENHFRHLIASTILSIGMVLFLLVASRLLIPSLVESIRYSWHRGELRAQYELSSERLKTVSLDSLADVSQLVGQSVGPSVVHINLLRDEQSMNQYEQFLGRSNPNVRYEGQGSGFVLTEDGYLLTNHHVVSGVGRIEVTLSDGRQLPAKVIGSDPPTDLALLKVEASRLMPISWGDSDQIVVGTPVWAVGSPFGLQQTVTFGIISGKHRVDFRGTRYEESVHGGTPYGDLMQSDVALNPGNSGGPLANASGEIIGVNAAILGETYRGISFSIPSKVAKKVASHLMNEGSVPRGWLGVRMEDLPLSDRYDAAGELVPGVRVVGFPGESASPARDAGLEVGDIIESFNTKPIENQLHFMKMIGEAEIGSTALLQVRRGETALELKVSIAKRQLDVR